MSLKCFELFKQLLYADNKNVLATGTILENLIRKVNHELIFLFNYFQLNKLSANFIELKLMRKRGLHSTCFRSLAYEKLIFSQLFKLAISKVSKLISILHSIHSFLARKALSSFHYSLIHHNFVYNITVRLV